MLLYVQYQYHITGRFEGFKTPSHIYSTQESLCTCSKELQYTVKKGQRFLVPSKPFLQCIDRAYMYVKRSAKSYTIFHMFQDISFEFVCLITSFVTLILSLKGQSHEIYDQVFFVIHLFPGPWRFPQHNLNFFGKFMKIFTTKVAPTNGTVTGGKLTASFNSTSGLIFPKIYIDLG